ncbi:MAG: cobalt ECF transporter T component CbiQ [Promethearchaeota archaeon]
MANFFNKNLLDIFQTVKDAMYSEDFAQIDGFLQRLNTKIKFFTLMLFLLAAIFTQNLNILLILIITNLALVLLSRLSVIYFYKRIILLITIFTGILALPYIFNIFQPNDGTPFLVLIRFNREINLPFFRPFSLISITEEGIIWTFTWIFRTTTAVSFSILLIMTTSWTDLLNSMEEMKFPKILILILGMTYRYIFLLLDTLTKMMYSRKCRTLGKEKLINSWKLNSHIIGALFIKSYDLSNNIYQAMISRGFQGEFIRMNINKTKNYRSWSKILRILTHLLSLGAAITIFILSIFI